MLKLYLLIIEIKLYTIFFLPCRQQKCPTPWKAQINTVFVRFSVANMISRPLDIFFAFSRFPKFNLFGKILSQKNRVSSYTSS